MFSFICITTMICETVGQKADAMGQQKKLVPPKKPLIRIFFKKDCFTDCSSGFATLSTFSKIFAKLTGVVSPLTTLTKYFDSPN